MDCSVVKAKRPDECPKCLAFIDKTAGLPAGRCLTIANNRRNVFCRRGIGSVLWCDTWPFSVKRDLLLAVFSRYLNRVSLTCYDTSNWDEWRVPFVDAARR